MNPQTNLQSLTFNANLTILSSQFQQKATYACALNSNGIGCVTQICNLETTSLDYCRSQDFDVLVGVLLPLTGSNAFAGSSSLNVLEMISNNIGYLYPGIQLLVVDTKSTGAGAIAAVQSLYATGVHIFVGPTTSEESVAVLNWTSHNANDTIFISPSASSTQLAPFKNFFSLVMDNSAYAPAMLTMIEKRRNNTATNVTILRRDDAFSMDLANQIKAITSAYKVTVMQEIIYSKDLNNLTEAVMTLAKINTTSLNMLIVIAFDEIEYLLLGADGYPKLKNITWIGSGFSQNGNIVTSPVALNVARQVQLTSFEYVGSNLADQYRYNQFFEKLAIQQNSIVSPLAAMVYDAVLIAFDTGNIYLTTDLKIIIQSLLLESENEYGISGWLLLTSGGFRAKGSLLASIIAAAPTPLNLNWIEQSYVEIRGSAGNYDVFVKNVGFHPIPPLQLSNCSSQTQITVRDISRRIFTFNFAYNTTFRLPAYDNFVVQWICGNASFQMECPSSFYGDDARCSYSFPLAKREGIISTAITCGAAAVDCVQAYYCKSLASDCLKGSGSCGYKALQACCSKNLFDFCCTAQDFIDSLNIDL